MNIFKIVFRVSFGFSVLIVLIGMRCSVAVAQIVPDNSLGAERSIVLPISPEGLDASSWEAQTNKDIISIQGGASRGTVLFHSFSDFNIQDNQLVTFQSAAPINNIIARVTGGSASRISGFLTSKSENLVIINPKGFDLISRPGISESIILRSPGNISLIASDSISLGSGYLFSAVEPSNIPSILYNAPVGLQPGKLLGSISLDGAISSQSNLKLYGQINADHLIISSQGSIDTTYGEINANTVNLDAVGGIKTGNINAVNKYKADRTGVDRAEVRMFSKGSIDTTAGYISAVMGVGDMLAFPGMVDLKAVGNIYTGGIIAGEKINLFSYDGSVRAENLTITSEFTVASSSKNSLPREINIYANKEIFLKSISAGITPSNAPPGFRFPVREDDFFSEERTVFQAGNINIEAPLVTIEKGAIVSTTGNRSGMGNSTRSGNISIRANEKLHLLDGSRLLTSADTTAMTLPGKIEITTGDLILNNSSLISAKSSSSAQLTAQEMIEAGRSSISISANNIQMFRGSSIEASTTGNSHAGSISLKVGEKIEISGINSGLSTIAESSSIGDGGSIFVDAKIFKMSDGSSLEARNLGNGKSGNISIDAQKDVTIEGSGTTIATNTNTPGSGGSISISGETINLLNGAKLDAQTSSLYQTGIGGDISLKADKIEIANDASVLTSTSGAAKAGNIFVDAAQKFQIIGTQNNLSTGLFATSSSSGSSGNISINTRIPSERSDVSLQNNATIQLASTGTGSGGNLVLNARDLFLRASSISSETYQGTGGNLDFNVANFFIMRNGSTISSSSGRAATVTTSPTENGGNILINARFLIAPPLENNDIKANAFNGKGGNVTINTQKTFGFTSRSRTDLTRLLKSTDPNSLDPIQLQTSDITAISQNNPTLNGSIASTELNVDPAKGLDGEPLTPSTPSVSEDCSTQPQSQGSRIINSGQGGLTPMPTDSLAPSNIWQDASTTNIRAISPPESILPIAQGWSRKDDQTVVLTGQTTPKPTAVACHTS
jgi:filamentous hemagglutinin family protein